MKISSIGWTDFSGGALNFVMRGKDDCECSEGCANCYVKALLGERFNILPEHTMFNADNLARLATMRFPEYSPKRGAPYKPMAFVSDTGDFFHESIPDGDLWDALDVLAGRTDVIWQILTKRAERMNGVVDEWLCRKGLACLPDHIWLGVTAENQRRADERIPALLATPAAVRFVSVEPCLEWIDLNQACWGYGLLRPSVEIQVRQIKYPIAALDQIIVGGESGPHRRPFDVAWALGLYAQCKDAGVPMFYKQGSALRPGQDDELPGIGKVKESR